MSHLDIVLTIIEKADKGDYPLEKEIGLARGCIDQWRRGRAKPSVNALIKVADYFNVPLDYLVGRTEPPEQELPKQLLDRWNQLDELQQARVTAYMDGLIAADIKSREA